MSDEKMLYSQEASPIVLFDGGYRWLSNFSNDDVEYEGVVYPTSEHAYQAAKTADLSERARIAAIASPDQAKRAGRKVTMTPDFEGRKDEVMTDILRAKFSRHADLAEKLVATYPAELVEGNTWHDNYWGNCSCPQCFGHVGANRLGQALMKVRLELLDAALEEESRLGFMREAARLAEANVSSGDGGPFGAVIVKDGKIVGRGRNMVLASSDSTAHAEIMAIRDAEAGLGTYDLSGCEIYTSCFPCPMCLGAIMWANITKCYFGNSKEDAAAIDFRDDAFYNVIKGVVDDEPALFSEVDLELEQLGRDETINAFSEYADKNMIIY